jgi:hypothetical protein
VVFKTPSVIRGLYPAQRSRSATQGIYNPTDVYYFFDATLETTLPGQSAGAAEVKISGRFQMQTLPVGS